MSELEPTSDFKNSPMFRKVKITEDDLPLFRQLAIKNWQDADFDEQLLVKYGNWVVNQDKSMIFKALGGGSFEIPEMYVFIYKGAEVRLERQYGKTEFFIPSQLSHEYEVVKALARKALSVHLSTTAS